MEINVPYFVLAQIRKITKSRTSINRGIKVMVSWGIMFSVHVCKVVSIVLD